MLAQIPESYLYEQYADDEDMQAFVASYNAGQQTIQQWFWANLLAFWPGLTDDLLDWCGQGIYGLPRTSIASLPTQALGPLNTEALNVAPLDSFVPSTQQVYAVNDDLYQRILTWHLYRGDGRNFSVRWLKRRIMRFLVGSNGLDPQPDNPWFTVGAETTSAIGVSLVNNTITVTLNQTLLSLQAQLAPNILQLFAAAFENGALELPLQYSYLVIIFSPFTAELAPPNIVSSATTAMITSAPVTVTAAGNSGPLTYLWSWISVMGEAVSDNLSGIITDSNGNVVWDSTVGAGIVIDDPDAAVTTFTANNMVQGEIRTGVASCLVTDTGDGQTITLTCNVTISWPLPPELLTGSGAPLLTGSGAPILTG